MYIYILYICVCVKGCTEHTPPLVFSNKLLTNQVLYEHTPPSVLSNTLKSNISWGLSFYRKNRKMLLVLKYLKALHSCIGLDVRR